MDRDKAERDRALDLIVRGMAPSRWHPFRRRAWFRSMRDLPGPNWSTVALDEAQCVYMGRYAEQIAAGLDAELHADGRLPDDVHLTYDWSPLGSDDGDT